jgi:hypothetical protein
MLFKTGEDTIKLRGVEGVNDGKEASKPTCSLRFINNPWGRRACEFVKMTKQLNPDHWESILNHASTHLTGVLDTDDEDNVEDSFAVNPQAMIILDQ